MATLGPIGSCQDNGSPTNVFYVDLTDRLGSSETVSSVTVSTDDTGFTITGAQATDAEITLDNGDTVDAGQAVQFRITTSTEQELDASLVVEYETDGSNADAVQVQLQIVQKLT